MWFQFHCRQAPIERVDRTLAASIQVRNIHPTPGDTQEACQAKFPCALPDAMICVRHELPPGVVIPADNAWWTIAAITRRS